MILVVAAEDEVDVIAQLRAAGEDAWGLGVLEPGDGGVRLI
jgi:hypothetical protein